ncbi:hypothetical protein ACET3X_002841 [Alternaria dauci]|uniref:Uncharacterized protein n=1 Tax=Alternaria dauci TaxID=48095 RepID=A0ABR3UR44_9PLEO
MDTYTSTRHALDAPPDTPDVVIFIVSVIIAFLSGIFFIDWIRRVHDIVVQHRWHAAQMKGLERSFGASEELYKLFTSMQSSINELHVKVDDASGYIKNQSDRIDEINHARDQIQEQQHQTFDIERHPVLQPSIEGSAQDFGELLVAVQTLQDTFRSSGLQKDSLQQMEGKMENLSKYNDELKYINTELRDEMERVEESAKNSMTELEQLRQVLADKNVSEKRLNDDHENVLSELQDLKPRLSSVEKELSKRDGEVRNMQRLHESTLTIAATNDAKIEELNKRLVTEANQVIELHTERDSLRKENESMSHQMRVLEEEWSQDKQQLDHLTNELNAAKKEKADLEKGLERLNQTEERQDDVLEYDADARDGSSTVSPRQTKDSEADADRQTTTPPQPVASEETSQGEPGPQPTEDLDTTPMAEYADNPEEEEDFEQHADANEEIEESTEAAFSPGHSPTQTMPEAPIESQYASDDNRSEDAMDPIASDSEPDNSPATPPAMSDLEKD